MSGRYSSTRLSTSYQPVALCAHPVTRHVTQVSGFSARDESSAFIPGWDTPPMVANWSYYKRGWRNGTSTTTDPVWTDLDLTCTHARMHLC